MSRVVVYRGAYHFFHPGQDPVQQAALFVSQFHNLVWTDLPPTIDFEVDDGVAASAAILNLEKMLNEVERRTQRRPMIYTGSWFWDPLIAQVGEVPVWLKDYPLWVAAYTNGGSPDLPSGWNLWSFWQYTDQGAVPGVNNGAPGVDLNRFNGSFQDMYNWMKKIGQPTQPPTIPRTTNQTVINTFSNVFGQNYWSKIVAAGLTALASPPSNRNLIYAGPAIEELPNLNDSDKNALKSALQTSGA